MTDPNDPLIGYSGYEIYEEAYAPDADECYIGDTEASARRFMDEVAYSEYRIEPVTLSAIKKDFGFSGGIFVMEPEALARFRVAANENGIPYETHQLESDYALTGVTIGGAKWCDD